MILTILISVIVVLLLLTNVRIVPQAETYVIERLGAYLTTWSVGLHLKLPLLDRGLKKSFY